MPQISSAPSIDFFSTSETVVTGAAPVTLNPNVYLTKIISGGTAGPEALVFPDIALTRTGIPHIVVFLTQTDPADVILLHGGVADANPIVAAGVNAPPLELVDPPTLESETAYIGVQWSGYEWVANNGDVLAIVSPAVSQVLYQRGGPAYGFLDFTYDPANPADNFALALTTSTDSGDYAIDPATTYRTDLVTTGSAAPEFAKLGSPSIRVGVYHLIRLASKGNAGDSVTWNPTALGSSSVILNADGSALTSITFSAVGDSLLIQGWVGGTTWRVVMATSGVVSPEL